VGCAGPGLWEQLDEEKRARAIEMRIWEDNNRAKFLVRSLGGGKGALPPSDPACDASPVTR
jgi:hypothetical protein